MGWSRTRSDPHHKVDDGARISPGVRAAGGDGQWCIAAGVPDDTVPNTLSDDAYGYSAVVACVCFCASSLCFCLVISASGFVPRAPFWTRCRAPDPSAPRQADAYLSTCPLFFFFGVWWGAGPTMDDSHF